MQTNAVGAVMRKWFCQAMNSQPITRMAATTPRRAHRIVSEESVM